VLKASGFETGTPMTPPETSIDSKLSRNLLITSIPLYARAFDTCQHI